MVLPPVTSVSNVIVYSPLILPDEVAGRSRADVAPVAVQLYCTMRDITRRALRFVNRDLLLVPARNATMFHPSIAIAPGAVTRTTVESAVVHVSERMMPTISLRHARPIASLRLHTSTWLLWTM